jgi:hypothetical protein
MVRRGRFRDLFRNYNTPVDRGWQTLDSVVIEVEKLAETRSPLLDLGAVSWLLNSLGRDQELEQFLAGIPGFYRSKRVEDPAQILRVLNTNGIPKAILAFMDSSLSSKLITGVTEPYTRWWSWIKRRVWLSMVGALYRRRSVDGSARIRRPRSMDGFSFKYSNAWRNRSVYR